MSYERLREKYHSAIYSKTNKLDGQFINACRMYDWMYGDYMPYRNDAVIADLACGAGQFLRYCSNHKYTRFIGVDLSIEQVEYVKKNVTDNVLQMDAFDYLDANIYNHDLIVANDFIEHITKERGIKLVGKIHQSLKDEGRIILKTGNMAAFGGLVIWCNGLDHECGYTEKSLRSLLRLWDFKDIRIIPYTGRNRWHNLAQRVFHAGLRNMYRYFYAGEYPKCFAKIIAVTGVKA